jgi:hypothetical protein
MLLGRRRLILIKFRDFSCILLLDHPALQLHARRQRPCFNRPLIRHNTKALHTLEVGQSPISLVTISLIRSTTFGSFTSTLWSVVAIPCPFAQASKARKVRRDQHARELVFVSHQRRLRHQRFAFNLFSIGCGAIIFPPLVFSSSFLPIRNRKNPSPSIFPISPS